MAPHKPHTEPRPHGAVPRNSHHLRWPTTPWAALSSKQVPSRLKVAFWLDVVLLVSVCALEQIPFTGAVIHEWLGLTFAALVVWHLLLSWSWISTQSRQLFPIRSARTLVNYLLNLSLFACVTAVVYSGIRISQEAIPLFTKSRIPIRTDSPWFFIHNQGSNLIVVLAGLHLALNWDWSLAAGRKLLRRAKAGAA